VSEEVLVPTTVGAVAVVVVDAVVP